MSNALPEGTHLRGGEYVLESVLGVGGFGITYRAAETLLRRHVAIKEFFPGGCRRDSDALTPAGEWTQELLSIYRQSFLREGRNLARLSHASIVPIHSVFEENASAYLVMEFVAGQTLRSYLASRNGRLEIDEALRYIHQAAEALSEVHSRGLLHRDIKPANLMLRPDGQLVLIDFGSAREISLDPQRHTALLTPGYAPYEQYDEYGVFGPATDIYALAAVLYHLLTGRVPVNAVSRRNGMALPAPRELVATIPADLSAAIMRGLEMDPSLRPASAMAFLERLSPENGSQVGSRRPLNIPEIERETRAIPPDAPTTELETGNREARPAGKRSTGPVCLRSFKGHQRAVTSVAWSPDGSQLVSAGRDSTLRLWNAENGDQLCVLEGHGAVVNSAAWSPDGRKIGSGSWYAAAIIWDAASGSVERTLSGHAKSIASVAWGPYSKLLATGGADKTARVWDAETGVSIATLQGHMDRVTAVAWSPDGATLATGSDDRTVRIWDTANSQETALLSGAMNAVAAVAWSPDGGRLAATGYTSGYVWIWNAAEMRLERTIIVDASAVLLTTYSAAWRPDCSLLAFGCQDGTVQIWDPHSGIPVHIISKHDRAVHSVAWSPDGSCLATGSEDQMVRIWEIP